CTYMEPPRFCTNMFPALGRHLSEFPEHRMEKPGEPDAFTPSLLTDTVHPVIPISGAHEWKAVTPNGKASVQRARTMLKECRAHLRDARLKIQFMLSLRQGRALKKRHQFIQQGRVAGHFKELEDGIRQPEQIVGDAGPHTAPGWRMPPVLNITLRELPRSGPQQMLACDIAGRDAEGHHVLELVTKPIGPAQLIKRRACPNPANQRLIEHPAIQQYVHRPLRRPDLYGAQHVVPTANDFVQERVHVGATVPVEQPTRLFPPLGLSKKPDNLRTFACLQLNRQLQRGTGVESGAHLPGQLTSKLKRQRTLGSPIATQEFCAISCPRGLLSSKINKGDPPM